MFCLDRVRSPITVEDPRIPMSAFIPLQPRFPCGGLTISSRVDALIRRDLLDPLPYVRRHLYGDWGDVREAHRHYNDAAVERGGYLLSSYAISDSSSLCDLFHCDRLHDWLLRGVTAICKVRNPLEITAGLS